MTTKIIHDSLPDGVGWNKSGYRLEIKDGNLVFIGMHHDSETQQEVSQRASISLMELAAGISLLDQGESSVALPAGGELKQEGETGLRLRLYGDSGFVSFAVSKRDILD